MNIAVQPASSQTIIRKWLPVGQWRGKQIEQLVFRPPRSAAAVAAERAVRAATVGALRKEGSRVGGRGKS